MSNKTKDSLKKVPYTWISRYFVKIIGAFLEYLWKLIGEEGMGYQAAYPVYTFLTLATAGFELHC